MDIAVKQLIAVVNEQLTKLEDAAEKCKSMAKASESQLKFFQQIHPTSRDLLEAANSNILSDQTIADILRRSDEIVSEESEGFSRLHSQLLDLAPAVTQLHRRYADE